MIRPHLLLAAAALAFATVAAAQGPRITQVATFDQEATGVAAAQDGRVFVNFPRWNADVPISVAEVRPNGSIVAYPNAEWNRWRNAAAAQVDPRTHFVNVQSLVADKRGKLWVLDPGAPNAEKVVAGAAKLVRIDLRTNQVTRIYPFDETVAPADSYLNDVRFTADGRHAFMTDSGRGALVVLDLESGVARRDHHAGARSSPALARQHGGVARRAGSAYHLADPGQRLVQARRPPRRDQPALPGAPVRAARVFVSSASTSFARPLP